MNRPEEQIQRAIVHYLRVALPNHIVFAIPNSAPRTANGKAMNAVPGLLPGIPDLALLGPAGRSYWFECKAPYGELSESQFAMRHRFIDLGIPHAVVRSIDDVRVALKAWNVETRETVA